MKKGFLHLLATLLMLASTAGLLVACSDSDDHSVTPQPSALPAVAAKVQGTEKLLVPTDYSNPDNWLAKPSTAEHKVDVIYLYPTAYTPTSDTQDRVSDIDDESMHQEAQRLLRVQASAFVTDDCNLFAPYYRQIDALHLTKLTDAETDEFTQFQSGTDPTSALDYYFEHLNQGRPFILCGHSQGAMNIIFLLRDYFRLHADYYSRMIAAYPIGYSVCKPMLSAYPHMKFAQGATDTGVIVSWNTEGAENKHAKNLVVRDDAVSINPLNWRLDETYASVEENLGSYPMRGEGVVEGLADARLDTERGVVVTTASKEYAVPEFMSYLFGPASYHGNDIGLFYMNIRQNVEQRIAAWFARPNRASAADRNEH